MPKNHQHTRAFFTADEREKAKKAATGGSQTKRLGGESQYQFGDCALCFSRLREPLASPSGYLYCQECILQNLLSQMQALNKQRLDYLAEKEAEQKREAAKEAQAVQKVIDSFAKSESSVKAASSSNSSSGNGGKGSKAGGAAADSLATVGVMQRQSKRMDERSKSEKLADLAHVSHWLPAFTPSAAAAGGTGAGGAGGAAGGSADTASASLKEPDPAPRDPCSGAFLRPKQLIPVQLEKLKEDSPAGGDAAGEEDAEEEDEEGEHSTIAGMNGKAARYMCPACMKGILYQKCYLASKCGHVTCADCTSKFVVPAKACFTCGSPIASKAGIIALQQGGSGFAGHEGTQTTASKWKPTLIC